MKVKYKGPKATMTALLPIGCKSMSRMKKILVFKGHGFEIDVDDGSARELTKADPTNFELVIEKSAEPKPEKKKKS
jgi:hypothetical protein